MLPLSTHLFSHGSKPLKRQIWSHPVPPSIGLHAWRLYGLLARMSMPACPDFLTACQAVCAPACPCVFLSMCLSVVTNPTVYNRSIYKYNLIDVYKYNLIDACINVFLESLERKFMLAIFMLGNLVWPYESATLRVNIMVKWTDHPSQERGSNSLLERT